MSCNNCGSSSCSQYLDAKCITVKNSYTCINVAKNDTLEEAIAAINDVICDLDPQDPVLYDVDGVNGEIVVTTSTIGDTTTFLVGLDPDITDLLVDIQDDISDINTELSSKICGITTNTPEYLDITNPSGCVYNIDFTPSGFVSYDGIQYQDYTQPETSGGIGTEILINYTNNFVSTNQITTGDIITVTVPMQLDVCEANEVILRFSSNSSTKHDLVFKDLYPQDDRYTTFIAEFKMRINVKSSTEAFVSSAIEVIGYVGDNSGVNVTLGQLGGVGLNVLPTLTKTVTGINWANTNFQVIVQDACGGVTKVGEFIVDVRKKL
jgi:hypothetical protein